MSLMHSPKIVTDGLVTYFDMSNPKSFKGSQMTNLLVGDNNGYPTTGNVWEVYNINQYNNGNYFSIGIVSNITDNLVTVTNAHPLRTYDVVRPQNSGGGLTAGVNYQVRKWSSTTFTLHAYNSSQDGSQGLSVLSNVLNDVRVPINSTDFPTMWWGAPHLPNSAIVKEVIPQGFSHQARIHDCLRIHWFRPDGVKDGMAYGIFPPVLINNVYSVTYYYRAATPSAVGAVVMLQHYVGGTSFGNDYFTLSKEWKKFHHTFTAPQTGGLYYYWFYNSGGGSVPISWDISEITCYAGSTVSEYTSSDTPRASTQTLKDLMGNIVPDTGLCAYDGAGKITFNSNVDNAIRIGTGTTIFPYIPTAFTLESWIYSTGEGTRAYDGIWGLTYGVRVALTGNNISFGIDDAVSSVAYLYTSGINFNNVWRHVVCTCAGTTMKIYVDGILRTSRACVWAGTTRWPTNTCCIGRDMNDVGLNFSGKIDVAKIYNRELSDHEIKQNFNALRGRYGI